MEITNMPNQVFSTISTIMILRKTRNLHTYFCFLAQRVIKCVTTNAGFNLNINTTDKISKWIPT